MHGSRDTTFRLGLTIVLALSLIAGLVLPEDAAAWWGKKKSRKEESSRVHRFNHYPRMEFVSGDLHRDGSYGWRVGNSRLALHETCSVEDDKGRTGTGSLRDGASAVVMGKRVGGALIAYHVIVCKPEWGSFSSYTAVDDLRGEVQIVWSTSDPSVGRGDAPK